MAAYLMYIKLEAIQDGIANLEPLPHRFERLALDKPYDVITSIVRAHRYITRVGTRSRLAV